jgi:hypothetical protein
MGFSGASPIIGFNELALEREGLNEETRSDIQTSIEIARRASLLTRQLLAFSRRQGVKFEVGACAKSGGIPGVVLQKS